MTGRIPQTDVKNLMRVICSKGDVFGIKEYIIAFYIILKDIVIEIKITK